MSAAAKHERNGEKKKMKLLIASDIHGSAYWCRRLLEAFNDEKADRLVLLGDLLYHGPRNDLPRDYAPKEVIAMLNELKTRIICVRGNCEAEVDQMVLDFPVMSDYSCLMDGERLIYLTHGHIFNKNNFPGHNANDVVLSGHTHVPVWEPCEQGLFFNPGSVSIPKNSSKNGYMTYENAVFRWKSFDDGEYASFRLE